jgi:hypothetical protein
MIEKPVELQMGRPGTPAMTRRKPKGQVAAEELKHRFARHQPCKFTSPY